MNSLTTTGLTFQREVAVWYNRAQKHFARVDFALPFDGRIVYVEGASSNTWPIINAETSSAPDTYSRPAPSLCV